MMLLHFDFSEDFFQLTHYGFGVHYRCPDAIDAGAQRAKSLGIWRGYMDEGNVGLDDSLVENFGYLAQI